MKPQRILSSVILAAMCLPAIAEDKADYFDHELVVTYGIKEPGVGCVMNLQEGNTIYMVHQSVTFASRGHSGDCTLLPVGEKVKARFIPGDGCRERGCAKVEIMDTADFGTYTYFLSRTIMRPM